MSEEKVVVIFKYVNKGISVDLEIPLNISANDLVIAINEAYDLNIDVTNIKNCYLKAERPITLLRGSKLLSEYGIRNGSIIYYTE